MSNYKLRKQILQELNEILKEAVTAPGAVRSFTGPSPSAIAALKRMSLEDQAKSLAKEMDEVILSGPGFEGRNMVDDLHPLEKEMFAFKRSLTPDNLKTPDQLETALAKIENFRAQAPSIKLPERVPKLSDLGADDVKALEQVELDPKKIKDLSAATDNELKSLLEIGNLTRQEYDTVISAKKAIESTPDPKVKFAKAREWASKSIGWCKSHIKTCIAVLAGALGTGAAVYLISKSTGQPASGTGGGKVPTTPEGGKVPTTPEGGETQIPPQVAEIVPGTPNIKTQSIRCGGDTRKDSIVAKYQRYVGVYPDGAFGKKTYAAGKNKGGDAALPDTWESYFTGDANTSAKRICTWLRTPGKSWSVLDGTIKIPTKRRKKKAPVAEPETTVNKPETPFVNREPNYFGGSPEGLEGGGRGGQGGLGSPLGRPGAREAPRELPESWHRKHQTSYSNNLFERLVKSVNNKKVI